MEEIISSGHHRKAKEIGILFLFSSQVCRASRTPPLSAPKEHQFDKACQELRVYSIIKKRRRHITHLTNSALMVRRDQVDLELWVRPSDVPVQGPGVGLVDRTARVADVFISRLERHVRLSRAS